MINATIAAKITRNFHLQKPFNYITPERRILTYIRRRLTVSTCM